MSNIYLVYGEEEYFIDNKIKKIISKYPGFDEVTYDMCESNIAVALEDISMGSLFSSNKIVICKNCYFLTGSKMDIDHKTDDLINYINNSNDNVLILSVISESLDNRKKVTKALMKENVFKFDKLKSYDLDRFINDYCKDNGFSISKDALILFKDKLINNLYIITSELDKLFIYKDNSKIDVDDINDCTSEIIDSNIFDLVNSIVDGDIEKSLKIYDELLILNEEEIKIIVTLANQFRLIYQVKTMYKKGYSERDIVSNLGVHPYRVKLASEVRINTKKILGYLKKLSLMDENIKLGKVDKKECMYKFILDL